jgi:hypothetical protein
MEGDAWFTDLADELARCLVDAERCATACEALLEQVRRSSDPELRAVVVEALIAPAAVARVLIELIDHPPRLVLAACRLCRDSAARGVERLEQLDSRIDSGDAITALRISAASCDRLLEATPTA